MVCAHRNIRIDACDSEEERALLTELVTKGKAAAYKIKHANVLLKVDANGPNRSDAQTAEAFSCLPSNA
ncbi:hypothetical protein [Candidatus Thiosymbion oneisti]|uniref:hypothetical protein n=1 Tax=Candidatus Thiosymbion oneisti TaxID=589554 RepID=UPI00105FED80|nr:hypothetical protein [Candidatus Thiosymbion oneisti]